VAALHQGCHQTSYNNFVVQLPCNLIGTLSSVSSVIRMQPRIVISVSRKLQSLLPLSRYNCRAFGETRSTISGSPKFDDPRAGFAKYSKDLGLQMGLHRNVTLKPRLISNLREAERFVRLLNRYRGKYGNYEVPREFIIPPDEPNCIAEGWSSENCGYPLGAALSEVVMYDMEGEPWG
jgi:hypothetical protein